MMSALTSRRVRFASNYRDPFLSTGLTDVLTGQTIETVRGNATRFEIGFLVAGVPLDLSEVESLNLKIQPSQTTDGALADQTLAAEDLDLTMDAASWEDGTKQHAAFEFTNAEMNIDPAGKVRGLWLVVTAITTGGNEVTLAAGLINLHEDNNGSLAEPPENPGTYLTLEQGDARYGAPGTTAPVNAAAYVPATGQISFDDGYVTDGDWVRIAYGENEWVFHFRTTPSAAYDVAIGDEDATTLADNLVEEINAVLYSSVVQAIESLPGKVGLTAAPALAGEAGNAVMISGSFANPATADFSGSSLTGGVDAVETTATPPHIRVADGYLYAMDGGVWKKATLSAL